MVSFCQSTRELVLIHFIMFVMKTPSSLVRLVSINGFDWLPPCWCLCPQTDVPGVDLQWDPPGSAEEHGRPAARAVSEDNHA